MKAAKGKESPNYIQQFLFHLLLVLGSSKQSVNSCPMLAGGAV